MTMPETFPKSACVLYASTRRGMSELSVLPLDIDRWYSACERQFETDWRRRFAVSTAAAVLHIALAE
ncbi:hypothetical protein B0G76_8614 [Paraburkholderia sp. BL23I1N1]|nr:hypothetical protein B0G76_8614 [Paraburkholderia sp. BL23I1N1]